MFHDVRTSNCCCHGFVLSRRWIGRPRPSSPSPHPLCSLNLARPDHGERGSNGCGDARGGPGGSPVCDGVVGERPDPQLCEDYRRSLCEEDCREEPSRRPRRRRDDSYYLVREEKNRPHTLGLAKSETERLSAA